jgi:hypothetical protein
MTTGHIQALGNLLATYNSDLTYIRDFHRHKNAKLSATDYLKKSTGTFKSFIDEFRVARNVDKTKTHILLGLTTEWIKQKHSDNVDDFAEQLKDNGITHGKVMTSLASKILFLNNPWTILPLDNLAKLAVGLKNNSYANYLPLTHNFIIDNKNEIHKLLSSVDNHLAIIEKQFEQEIENIKVVRQNRFADKLLWTSGRTK